MRTQTADSLDPELEACVAAVEQHLLALGEALRECSATAIELQASELQRTLAAAVNRFACAARQGRVPGPLRQRLGLVSGQVAAQRESLARATAALDRAIDVLMPGAAPSSASVYSIGGGAALGQRRSSAIQV